MVFFLILLSDEFVYQIPGTDYWALKKWAQILNMEVVEKIIEWFDEVKVPANLQEIANMLEQSGYCLAEEELEALLLLWPELERSEDGLIRSKLNITEIEPKILKSYILNVLRDARKGIHLADLHEYLNNQLILHSITISKRELKLFLQSWGDVAIVRPKVYLMEKAPLSSMRLGDIAYQIVSEIGQPVEYNQLESELRDRSNYTGSVSSILLSEPKLMRPSRGYYALREWGLSEYNPDIHNRISDILVSIIGKAGRPLHKSEIRRYLRRAGIRMNEVTLQMDIIGEQRITQVARGVYALTQWNLNFRELFRYKFPFRLQLPDGENNIYELEDGIIFEYMVTKYCIEIGRILIRRHMIPYFPDFEPYLRIIFKDSDGDSYVAWTDKMSDNRWQILGVKRWYKTYKPRYGDSIFIKKLHNYPYQLELYTSEQAEALFGI